MLNDKSNLKNNLLLISFSYAPSGKVGAKRFINLSKYFQINGYTVNVLTVKKKYYTSIDKSLEVSGKLYRTGMFPPYPIDKKNFFTKIYLRIWEWLAKILIDPYSGWIIPGIIKGISILRKNKIDIIIVTGPPFSSFLIAYFLSKIFKKKLILDFRDPWTIYSGNLSKVGLWICKKLENKIIDFADALIFNTMKAVQLYSQKNESTKIEYISNAYDYSVQDIVPVKLEKNKLVILYAGNFYGARKLSYLFDPLIKLFANGLIQKEQISIHVFGELCDEDIDLISKLNLNSLINKHSKVEYKNIISYMKGADILYLPQGPEVKYSLAYKFFDYLGVKKPILAVTSCDSAISDIMHEIECGEIANMENNESIYQALHNILIKKNIYSFNGIEKYSWQFIAEKYLRIIKTI